MICHPYKSDRCDHLRHFVLRGAVRAVFMALVAMWSFMFVPPVAAQWVCGPMWGPPPTAHPTYHFEVAQPSYVILGQSYAQSGPTLPPIIIENVPSTNTFYSPENSGLPAIDAGAASYLTGISGQFRVVIAEAFLNRLLSRSDTDAGPVTDFVLGANVTGHQNTKTCLSVDVQPSDRTARLILQLNGTTTNQTIGVTRQAAIQSRGNHDFRMTKQIDFDGLRFTTRSPAAWVTPRLTNEAANTMFTGVPLIGPFAGRIALSEAERRRPIAEQIITQRVTEQAAPRFNSEVDQQLADANIRLQHFAPRALELIGLDSESIHLSSTDNRLLCGLSVSDRSTIQPESTFSAHPTSAIDPQMPDDESGFVVIRQIGHRDETNDNSVVSEQRAFRPPPGVVEGNAFTVAVHEEMVNHVLQRLPLGGLEVPDHTINRLVGLLIEDLADLSLPNLDINSFGSESPDFATILLADDNTLLVRFDEGQMTVTVQAGFRPLMTPEVPTQRVRISYTLSSNDSRWTLVPDAVTVESLSGSKGSPIEEIARPIIEQQVQDRLRTFDLPSSFRLAASGLAPMRLSLRSVTFADGWLVIAVD